MLSNQEQKERTSRIIALAGTILLHALACMVLLRLALQKPSSILPEVGIEVDLNYQEVSGTPEDSIVQHQNTDSIKQAALGTTAEALKTENQDREQAGKQATNNTSKPKTIIETPLARIVNPKLIKPSGSNKAVEKPIQTSPVKPGEIAKPGGASQPAGKSADTKTYTMLIQLEGRETVYLEQPTFSPAAEGRIAVSIIVNQQGKVVYASSANKGTTVQDIRVRIQAEEAVRKTVFTPDRKASSEQKGMITFTLPKPK